MGGKCVLCSYHKCSASMVFHHVDGGTKEFNIAAGGYYRSWRRVEKELKKCVLVCGNCHGEVHTGLVVIPG